MFQCIQTENSIKSTKTKKRKEQLEKKHTHTTTDTATHFKMVSIFSLLNYGSACVYVQFSDVCIRIYCAQCCESQFVIIFKIQAPLKYLLMLRQPVYSAHNCLHSFNMFLLNTRNCLVFQINFRSMLCTQNVSCILCLYFRFEGHEKSVNQCVCVHVCFVHIYFNVM